MTVLCVGAAALGPRPSEGLVRVCLGWGWGPQEETYLETYVSGAARRRKPAARDNIAPQ